VVALGLVAGGAVAVSPLVLLLALVPFVVAVLRHRPIATGLFLLIAGPLTLAAVEIGAMTADNYVTMLGLLVVLVGAIVKRKVPFTGLSVFPLLVALAILLSGLRNGIDPTSGIIRFLGLALVPWATVNAESRTFAFRALKLVILVVALSVITQPITNYPPPFAFEDGAVGFRYGGLAGHPNFTCYTLAMVAMVVIGQRRLSKPDYLLVGAIGAAMLMTGSVAAAVYFGGAVLLVLLQYRRRLLGLAVVGAIGLAAAGGTLLARLGAFAATGNGGPNSATWRETQWQQVLMIWRDGHQLAGYGWQQTDKLLANGLEAHSGYVQTLGELGVVGAVIVLCGLIALATVSVRTVLAAALVGYVLLTAVSDPTFYYPPCATTLFVLLALIRRSPEDFRPEPTVARPAAADETTRSERP
jgi:O-antigen ligase